MDSHARRIASLSPEKRALFEARLKKGQSPANASAIARPRRDADTPLSVDQERLWLMDQLEPGGHAYHINWASRISGPLDVKVLERCFGEIIRRHEVLRTTFPSENGIPHQRVGPARPFTLPFTDLSVLPDPEREGELLRRIVTSANRPFNLSEGPLMRVELFRLGGQEHAMILTLHHIITDGWSMGVFRREMAALYDAFHAGRPSPLKELPIQFADFAAWQREWLRGEECQKQLAYWKRRLAGAPSATELPTDRPRRPLQTYRGRKQTWRPPQELWKSFKALCQREGVTTFIGALTLFNVLLHRHTGQDDISVGFPSASRTRPETQGLIGYLLNMLVMRTDLSGDPTVRELLGRVREVAVGAYAHSELPYGRLVEEMAKERDTNRNPLFQICFIIADFQDSTPEGASTISMRPIEFEGDTAKFDLTLALNDSPHSPSFIAEYNTDLFDDTTITRLLEHLHVLLEGVVAAPERRVSALPLLGEDERRQLLSEWNETAAEYPRDKPLHELIAAQADRTPDAVAVVFRDERLTYRELNARADKLAHHLRRRGVAAETRVGVCVERSIEMVVGLLSILKAGGAYVPLDPHHPKERLAFVMEDAGVSALLTQSSLLERLPEQRPAAVLLDADGDSVRLESEREPASRLAPENLAYVIYTSGSTGRPKGVAIAHRSIVNLLTSMRRQIGLSSSDRLLAVTTLSFDIAALEIFLPLITGACVVVADDEVAADGGRLQDYSERHGVTVMQTTPSRWRMLLETGWRGGERLKILTGGEALPPVLAERLSKHGASVWNLYGPTETAVWATACEVERGADIITIGRPVGNTEVYLLDANREPVPVGVAGELYIGGDGLARGYENRPDLTAERFVPNPFACEPGARMYRTGDLARFLADGRVEHLGRMDYQVKLRGFRVELGEIESVILEHEAVREAVVVAREESLVAYVTTGGEEAPAHFELRAFLESRLPGYMIPAQFVKMERLPLSLNGKVDRKQLPAPEETRPELRVPFVAPRTPTEEKVAEVWMEVLGLERVGVNDNFFQLGGHSLLATQILSRVRAALGADVSLRALLESPTVEGLSRLVTSALDSGDAHEAAPVTRVKREGDLPLSFAQQRLWFLHQLNPQSTVFNLYAALRLSGRLDLTALGRTLTEVVRRHESLRTTFAAKTGTPRQVITPPAPFEFDVVDLAHLPAEEAEARARQLASEEVRRPFDLSSGPLLRAKLFRLATRSTSRPSRCTTSSRTGGRWASSSAKSRRSTRLTSKASRRRSRNSRFSTRTSPRGSASA
nr:condensation domain-containing protein [uncultured bacterium]